MASVENRNNIYSIRDILSRIAKNNFNPFNQELAYILYVIATNCCETWLWFSEASSVQNYICSFFASLARYFRLFIKAKCFFRVYCLLIIGDYSKMTLKHVRRDTWKSHSDFVFWSSECDWNKHKRSFLPMQLINSLFLLLISQVIMCSKPSQQYRHLHMFSLTLSYLLRLRQLCNKSFSFLWAPGSNSCPELHKM
jgi:hypothetical protein